MPSIRLARLGASALTATTALAALTLAGPAHADQAPPDASGTTSSGVDDTANAELTQWLEKRRERRERREAAEAKRFENRLGSALDTALAQRGDAYSYGASGPNAFDCSGLVQYAFGRAGFSLPRTSAAQAGHARRIGKDDLRPGDLMFFAGSGGVYHVGIFVRSDAGGPLMVHAPGSGSSVQVARPWTSSWFAGTLRPA